MSEIKRYTPAGRLTICEDARGNVVLYTDHQAQLSAALAEVELRRKEAWKQTEEAAEQQRLRVVAEAELAAKDALLKAAERVIDKVERLNLDLGMCYSEAIQDQCDEYAKLKDAQ